MRNAIVELVEALQAGGLDDGRLAQVSCRWNRSGQAGFLVTPDAFATRPDAERIVWQPLDGMPANPCDGRWGDLMAAVHRHRENQPGFIVISVCDATAAVASDRRVALDGIGDFHGVVKSFGGHDIRSLRAGDVATDVGEAVRTALAGRSACLVQDWGVLVTASDATAALLATRRISLLAAAYVKWLAMTPEARGG